MKTYLLKAKNTLTEAIFKYDLNGYLIAFNFNELIDEKQKIWLLKYLPKKETQLLQIQKNQKTLKISIVPQDLSFENFYKLYNYKQKRKQAEATWNRMTKMNKQKALAYIPTYNNKLNLSGANKAYPASYLNQEYFND